MLTTKQGLRASRERIDKRPMIEHNNEIIGNFFDTP
jgi:hypothetical protein